MVKPITDGFKAVSEKAQSERLENLPPELTRGRRQFIAHDSEKKPINPNTGSYYPIDKARPWVTSPEKWGAFWQAKKLCEEGRAAGVGFVLTAEDPYICLDLDGVRDPKTGFVAEWAVELVENFASYTEISMSGRGLHIFIASDVREPLPHGVEYTWRGLDIEIYDHSRYIALTGKIYQHSLIEDRSEELAVFLEEAEPPRVKTKSACGCSPLDEKEPHPVCTEAMLDLFSKLGVEVGCEADRDYRCECPFHPSDKNPGRGGNSLLINPQKGWKCWSGCGEGGLAALREKLLLQSDDELATIAHRTGVKLEKLIELREGLMPEPARKDVVVSIEPPEDLTKHYLEVLRGYDGYVPLNKCGTYTISSNGLYETVRHNPCKRWECHYCGTRRRALDEIGLIPIAQGLKELYDTVISDNEWKTNELLRRKRFSILKVKFRYFKTRQYPGQIVLLSTHPYNDDSELIPLEDRASLIRHLLEDLRKQAYSGERLTDGSRSWSTSPKKKTARKAAEKPADDIIDVEEAEVVFRGFSACEPRRALEFAIAIGLTDAGEELDMRLWPDGERRPSMVRFVRQDDSKYQEWMMKLQMRVGLRGVG